MGATTLFLKVTQSLSLYKCCRMRWAEPEFFSCAVEDEASHITVIRVWNIISNHFWPTGGMRLRTVVHIHLGSFHFFGSWNDPVCGVCSSLWSVDVPVGVPQLLLGYGASVAPLLLGNGCTSSSGPPVPTLLLCSSGSWHTSSSGLLVPALSFRREGHSQGCGQCFMTP